LPKNRLIYLGVLVVAACALLYGAFHFTALVQPILPWTLGVGALLIVIGIFIEANKSKSAKALGHDVHSGEKEANSVRETTV
jgi:hypothetical protein